MFYNYTIDARFTAYAHEFDNMQETIISALQCAKQQTIQIFMNINRIINKYIISKYVRRESKPG